MKNSKAHVKVIKGNIQVALKKWKSKVIESGHLEELRERKQYLKPSVVNRKMKKDAIRTQQWAEQRYKQENG